MALSKSTHADRHYRTFLQTVAVKFFSTRLYSVATTKGASCLAHANRNFGTHVGNLFMPTSLQTIGESPIIITQRPHKSKELVMLKDSTMSR